MPQEYITAPTARRQPSYDYTTLNGVVNKLDPNTSKGFRQLDLLDCAGSEPIYGLRFERIQRKSLKPHEKRYRCICAYTELPFGGEFFEYEIAYIEARTRDWKWEIAPREFGRVAEQAIAWAKSASTQKGVQYG